MNIPVELHYTNEHEWLRINGDAATVGVTEYAVSSLGDIVFLQLPAVGQEIAAGEVCGEIESTKSVSDLYSPADGQVTEINEAAVADPAQVNSDPFGQGWLFRITLNGMPPEPLDADTYAALTSEGV
jgi:glycine cleavage system H protein